MTSKMKSITVSRIAVPKVRNPIKKIDVYHTGLRENELRVTCEPIDPNELTFHYLIPGNRASVWSLAEVRKFAKALIEFADQIEGK